MDKKHFILAQSVKIVTLQRVHKNKTIPRRQTVTLVGTYLLIAVKLLMEKSCILETTYIFCLNSEL